MATQVPGPATMTVLGRCDCCTARLCAQCVLFLSGLLIVDAGSVRRTRFRAAVPPAGLGYGVGLQRLTNPRRLLRRGLGAMGKAEGKARPTGQGRMRLIREVGCCPGVRTRGSAAGPNWTRRRWCSSVRVAGWGSCTGK
jgi:hypothetical protein